MVVKVNTRGTVALTGGKLRRSARLTTGTAEVPVRLRPAVRRNLRTYGHVKVKVTVTFTAASGGTARTTRTVVIRKR